MDRERGSDGSCYYSILRICKDASFSDIRTAYRKLALPRGEAPEDTSISPPTTEADQKDMTDLTTEGQNVEEEIGLETNQIANAQGNTHSASLPEETTST
ncbi:hypothetical protein LOK49_LG13G00158 [Camellia lanceoleosa]|uniref:Uncharacterized protein n=1 Tax=Camellia lanceoleosa TaxID=1840588 RepID=A0ACC0FGT2_9ERIC|nr:hypothetical protein LOK49_LG13G00158 [Camellia lanceoleosa]